MPILLWQGSAPTHNLYPACSLWNNSKFPDSWKWFWRSKALLEMKWICIWPSKHQHHTCPSKSRAASRDNKQKICTPTWTTWQLTTVSSCSITLQLFIRTWNRTTKKSLRHPSCKHRWRYKIRWIRCEANFCRYGLRWIIYWKRIWEAQ